MTPIHETAYPRIRSNVTEKELNELYTPTQDQMEFADTNAREPIQKLGLLILIKTFQRLGYFPPLSQVPHQVIQHIACCARLEEAVANISNYEKVGSRRRHKSMIRALLGIEAFQNGGDQILNEALVAVCYTKDIIADIINAGIEELVRQRYELPGFSTLLRAAITARSKVNHGLYQKVYESLSVDQKERIRVLLARNPEEITSDWERLKKEPKRTTVKNMRELTEHLNWLKSLNVSSDILDVIPESKLQRLSDEARTLNIAQVNEMEVAKRYTLAVVLVRAQIAQVMDDLTDMLSFTQ